MRKIKTMAGLLVLACALLTGCGKKEEATTTEVTTTEATTEATTTEATTEATPIDAEEELPAIGTESADAIKVKLTNKTGKDITGVAVKNMDSEAWSDNLLTDDDSFTDKEKRYLYYTPDASEENSTESEEGDILTYAQGQGAERHPGSSGNSSPSSISPAYSTRSPAVSSRIPGRSWRTTLSPAHGFFPFPLGSAHGPQHHLPPGLPKSSR